MTRVCETMGGQLTRLSLVFAVVLMGTRAFASDWVYVVSQGDTLWNLSEKYLGSSEAWVKVQRVNQFPDPDDLSPGTKVRIPLAWIASNSVPARAQAVQGKVYVLRSDGSSETLQSGAEFKLGDRVQTTAPASVTIEFADSSVVTLTGGSELSFDHLSAHGDTGMVDTRLRLHQGRLETRVTPASGPGSRFEIHTASAISAVRGTAYRMTAGEGLSSNVEVTAGVVDVKGAATSGEALLDRGFGTVVVKGEAPLPPKELLPAPRYAALPGKLENVSWPVSWTPLKGAKRYRAQLSLSPGFETLRWEHVMENPRLRLPDLPDGEYYLRLRGIDELGLEGMDSAATLLQAAHPQPPLPLQTINAGPSSQAPTLGWTRSLEADSYHLQVSADPSFKNLLVDRRGIRGLEYVGTGAGEGTWYWRVAGIDAQGRHGPFGAVRQFVVTAAQALNPAATVTQPQAALLSWRAGGQDKTYRVQIARDKRVKRLILNVQVAEAQIAIESKDSKPRYLRVQTIDADGQTSAWSGVQEIPADPGAMVAR